MDSSIDYSQYSLSELKDARRSIDAQRYPERAAELERRIAAFSAQAASEPASVSREQNDVLRHSPVTFYGSTGEYFSIWIVNVLLSIVTLGIYSAWAKVRTNRYFYANTDIDGHRFTYLATPLQILKGRLIAVCLFACYFLLSSLHPLAGAIVALTLAVLTPVLVVLSYRFKLRMTAYRHVRFHFDGSIKRAFVVLLLLPIASVFTLYTILPIVLKKIDAYLIDGSGYGDRQFSSRLSTAEYYGSGLGALGIAMGIFMVGGLLLGVSFTLLVTERPTDELQEGMVSLLSMGFFALYGIAYVLASGFYSARIRNHIFTHTGVEGVAEFSSNVGVWALIWLRVSNMLGIVCSLGLAIPWARVRSARFYANATQVAILPGIEEVVADDPSKVGALGDEAATLFDVDVALG
ncbi:YjgN family protein [Alteromonas sp. 14N.309.X.WAT.G.H12]|uniref:YjgN family protein n=1 Tax=Alteromonas sp. 14N.309.X.WAT.G.H12 TaxID=3120824 RepID=UPI002FD12C96